MTERVRIAERAHGVAWLPPLPTRRRPPALQPFASSANAPLAHSGGPHSLRWRVCAIVDSQSRSGKLLENSGGIVAGLSGRYATALYALAGETRSVDNVAASLAALREALSSSSDLHTLTTSPVIDRAAAGHAIAAVAKALALDPLTTRFVGTLAANRRLAALPAIIADFARLAARARGEVSAEVTSAHPLSEDQVAQLKAKLRAGLGADAALELRVDPEILGGLIVRTGSRLVDSSLRTKLNNLATAMKG